MCCQCVPRLIVPAQSTLADAQVAACHTIIGAGKAFKETRLSQAGGGQGKPPTSFHTGTGAPPSPHRAHGVHEEPAPQVQPCHTKALP